MTVEGSGAKAPEPFLAAPSSTCATAETEVAHIGDGVFRVRDWQRLINVGEVEPSYLQICPPAEAARSRHLQSQGRKAAGSELPGDVESLPEGPRRHGLSLISSRMFECTSFVDCSEHANEPRGLCYNESSAVPFRRIAGRVCTGRSARLDSALLVPPPASTGEEALA